MTLTEQIAAVLAEHGGRGALYCSCGEPAVLRPGQIGQHKGFITWHRAHVAAHLAPLVRQAQAEAWERGLNVGIGYKTALDIMGDRAAEPENPYADRIEAEA